MSDSRVSLESEREFFRARRKAQISSIVAKIKGEDTDLLSFEEARSLLGTLGESYQGQQTIEIDKIIGSEGRYQDFDREFLPRKKHTVRRWQSISTAHSRDINLPSIQVYEIGNKYFIRDGNHRVSVARSRGTQWIDAEVTKVNTRIDIGDARDADEIKRAVLDYERKQFLAAFEIIEKHPKVEIRFTAVGSYDDIAIHIASHRKLMETRRGEAISYDEATESWYHTIYLPMAHIIRDSGVLNILPSRTESDYYVWLVRHWDDIFPAERTIAGWRIRRIFQKNLAETTTPS